MRGLAGTRGLIIALATCTAAWAGEGAGAANSGGVEYWTVPTMDTVQAGDGVPAVGGIQPIRIAGARNGTFSGKVVLRSPGPGPIRGLKASVGDLVESGGKNRIAGSAVQVRWADWALSAVSWTGGPNPRRIVRFDRLLETFPPEISPANPYVGERQAGPMVMVPI